MEEILSRLEALAEDGYRAFSRRLIPTQRSILGVRAPHLRKLTAEVLSGDCRSFLEDAPDDVLEVLLIKAGVLGGAPMDAPERQRRVRAFLPLVDNWAVCDTLMAALRPEAGEREGCFAFIAPFFTDEREFFARFGAIMLLHFSDAQWIDRALAALGTIRQPGYYARMGVAWTLSMLYVDFPEKAKALIESHALDAWTHNKAIQKIIESRQVEQSAKDALRALKRKAPRGQVVRPKSAAVHG
jgi:3-methyladenine DNA glycosylase AlkD